MKNIIFIMTDQQRSDTLNDKLMPNVTNLAKDSVKFTNAFVQCSQCQPSRACILTGRYVSSHRLWWNGTKFNPNEITIAHALEGYESVHFGKIHLTATQPNDHGFSQWYETDDWYKELNARKIKIKPLSDYFSHPFWSGQNDTPPKFWFDNMVANKAIDYLKQPKSKPFFLTISFFGPHPPYAAPGKYGKIYDPQKIKLSPTLKLKRIDTGHTMTEANWRHLISQYYGLITLIDDAIARIIKTLKEQKLYDDSIIVFISDHGDILGDHGFFSKGEFLYDGVIKIPMLIKAPGVKPQTITRETESIDIMPTLLKLCNKPLPLGVQGCQIPELTGIDGPTKQAVYSTIGRPGYRLHMVRGLGWKYLRNEQGQEWLFNLTKDPHETQSTKGDAINLGRMALLQFKLRSEDKLFPIEKETIYINNNEKIQLNDGTIHEGPKWFTFEPGMTYKHI